ncbi:MAG: hypothetical protein K0Q79_2469 [Flavipsychrobacter sp.]|nr:hypothetical protein [Flavipsychrobacter sp.]
MKNSILLSCFLIAAITLASCKKNDPAPSNTARVMFVNGCAGAAAIDVAANSVNIAGATNIGFQKNTGYRQVAAGTGINIGVSINASGLITPLINSAITLNANTSYTTFIGGIFTKPNFVFTTDDLTAPPAGFTKIRFVNLSSDTLNEHIFVGSNKIDSNVGYASVTPFRQIAVATTPVNVLVQDPAQPTKIAQLSSQTFSSGKIYTLMLTGTSSGTSTSALTLLVLPNN